MKIVHIFHNYYPKIGGMENAVRFLAEEQAKLGFEVSVVSSRTSLLKTDEEAILNGVKIVRVGAVKIFYNDFKFPFVDPKILEADIIHAHSQNSLFSLILANRLKKKLGSKLVFSLMAVDSYRDHPSFFVKKLGSLYGRTNTKKAIKMSDLLLVKSKRDQEILRSRYDSNADYLQDAVPENYFESSSDNEGKFKERFNIKQDYMFLFVGRIHKLKGPDTFVKSMAYLKSKNIAAVFIGPDFGYREYIINLAKKIGVADKVYILGIVDEKEKINAIDEAVALVVPSLCDYSEVFSIVISEAWSRMKPVIASEIGEIPYRIQNGANGILVEPGDPKMLADAMEKLLQEPETRDKMGLAGKANVRSWKKIANESINLYSKIT